MVRVKFVSPFTDEIDVVALGLTFKRGEIRDVTEQDAELLLRSSAFERIAADYIPPPPEPPKPAPAPEPVVADEKPSEKAAAAADKPVATSVAKNPAS